MNNIKKVQLNDLGFNFIDKKYIPEGNDEFYLRYTQSPEINYRYLTSEEIIILKSRGNTADNWNNIRVTENFSPNRIKNNKFYGLIRIGDIDDIYLDFHDLHQPAGIYDSTIVSCDIGSNVAISNVKYLSHYIVSDTSILININEMITSPYAKFGNGIIKDGEDESVRIELEISNENGNRSILPFNGMLPADAYIWSKYRDDTAFQEKLKEMTQSRFDSKRGYYGVIGEYSVLKNCRIIKDVNVGSHAYIKGCNKLKNLTINSNSNSSTQLGEGIELVNGIVGFGCRIFYGVKAIRFIMSDYSTLKYGARLINSFLGSNSTISCCEVLNSLIFPGHEQHHNNSFLCAATLMGQSNIASGATIGSNHNSRANDGEIVAERGFWPGLCTSLKHNSRFSSFNLLAKGAYPAEINNPLPFSLLSNNETDGELTVIPAYWFMYNLYALARNSWKYSVRDKRKIKKLYLEFDYLAPDTINEMHKAMVFIKNQVENDVDFIQSPYSDPVKYLKDHPEKDLMVDNIENTKRKTRIHKCGKAYFFYRDFILFYIIRTIIEHCEKESVLIHDVQKNFTTDTISRWISIGGQLITTTEIENLKNSVKSGKLNTWESIHGQYSEYADVYHENKLKHCFAVYAHMFNNKPLESFKENFQNTCRYIYEGTYNSRKKDYHNDYRLSTYDNKEEMEQVVGKLEDNSFIKVIGSETEELIKLSEKYF
jgi:Domain of unknown function (DUF4954)/Domain of unknown function (DUF6819)